MPFFKKNEEEVKTAPESMSLRDATIKREEVKAPISQISPKPLLTKTITEDPVDEKKPAELPPTIEQNVVIAPKPIESEKPRVAIVVKEQNEIKENIENLQSEIVKNSITRLVDTATDLSCIYTKQKIIRLDILTTQDEFKTFIERNLQITDLDISDCYNIVNFTLLENLTNLEQLDLTNCTNITDFSFLKNLKKLKVLSLSNTNIENLDVLENCRQLEVLNLKIATRIRSLNGIENSPLHDLNLFGCTALKEISALGNNTQLRSIDLTACGFVKDISFLKNARQMKYVNFNYTLFPDLSVLTHFIELEFFTMDFTNVSFNETICSYFANLLNLKSLNLRNKGIIKLDFLSNLTKLKVLDISGNMIKDIAPLSNLTEMKELSIGSNVSITDISALSNMRNLECLDINGLKSMPMMINNIDVVENMPNLKVIRANFNKNLKTIEPLKNCTKLEEVAFEDCLGISDITPLRFSPNLKSASFKNDTMIKNFSFLRQTTIGNLNLEKTSIKQIYIGAFNGTPNFKVDENNEGIIKLIFEAFKINKKIINFLKIIK
ncbi:MAG: hypothetical protein Ta2D_12700 [Rickettsiales bacterium]|nr:MAG: hypothetical protein Ta2D_12700 [Rickettsiales bacterium]